VSGYLGDVEEQQYAQGDKVGGFFDASLPSNKKKDKHRICNTLDHS
jgi:hypothetical protein